MKVMPETQWDVEIDPINADRFDLSFVLLENGVPVSGFGADIGRDDLAKLIAKLQAAL